MKCRAVCRTGCVGLLVLLVTVGLIQLGRWQLSRYADKQALVANYTRFLQETPKSLAEITALDQPQFHRVRLQGRYLNTRTVLLDNRMRHGVPGFEVLTPFELAGGTSVILVNRGWLSAKRIAVDGVPTMVSTVCIGYVVIPEQKGVVLGALVENLGSWPLKIQKLTVPVISGLMGRSLYPWVIRLQMPVVDGIEQSWPLFNLQPDRHFGYAIQWFGLALVLVIGYGVVLWRKS